MAVVVAVRFAHLSTFVLLVLYLRSYSRTHAIRLTHTRLKSVPIVLCIVRTLSVHGIRSAYIVVHSVAMYRCSYRRPSGVVIVCHHVSVHVAVPAALYLCQRLGHPFPCTTTVPVTMWVGGDTHSIIHPKFTVCSVCTLTLSACPPRPGRRARSTSIPLGRGDGDLSDSECLVRSTTGTMMLSA